MKKLLVVLLGVALLYSCEKESDVLQDETNLELKDGGLSAEAEAENLYFGVFVSNDLELHGQIQVDLNEGAKHAAHVRLLNGKELYFKAATDLADDNIVHFKGTSGSFTIDFADASDMRATSFMVEGKEGHVKVYVQKTPGIPPPILFGFYEDLADPTFTGAFDVLTFGAVEPTVGLPLIEDIIITHIPNGTMYSDEDIGIIEPFVVPSCPGVPLPPIIAESGFTDGVIVAAIWSSIPLGN